VQLIRSAIWRSAMQSEEVNRKKCNAIRSAIGRSAMQSKEFNTNSIHRLTNQNTNRNKRQVLAN
jgi:hypothetical protein